MGLDDGIWALRLGFRPGSLDLGLEAEILALRLKFETGGWVWVSRLGFGPQGCFFGQKVKKVKKEEKFPLYESIGHRPLRGRCPKSNMKSLLDWSQQQ